MKKTPKKLVFELDARQILFVFVGLIVVGFMVFQIGVVVGSRSTRAEMLEARLNEDPRRKIKAPSLLKAEKIPSMEKEAPTIEGVLNEAGKEGESTASEKKVSSEKKADVKVDKAKPEEKKIVSSEKKSSSKPEKTKVPKGPENHYFVQVASFPSAADAGKRGAELKNKGYNVVIVKADIPGKGTYHRVRLGPFSSLGKAKSFALKFEKKEKVSTFIPID